MKFVRVFKIPFAIWALHVFLLMAQAEEDHSQISCKQCSCLQRSQQEFKSATTFLAGVNINVFLGWRTMKRGNSFMISWCLMFHPRGSSSRSPPGLSLLRGPRKEHQRIQRRTCWFLSHYYCPAKISEEHRSSSWHLCPPIPLLLMARTLKFPKKLFAIPKAIQAQPVWKCHCPVPWHSRFYEGFTA